MFIGNSYKIKDTSQEKVMIKEKAKSIKKKSEESDENIVSGIDVFGNKKDERIRKSIYGS